MPTFAPRLRFAPGSRRAAWFVVAALWVVAMLNYLDRQVLVNMQDAVSGDIAMNATAFGGLTTVFLVVYGLASPLGGWFADRYGRRPVILASLAVWSLATWFTGHVSSYPQLLVARGVMGFSEACYIPAGLALISDFHAGRTRSLATGLHMSGLYAGKILGGLGGFYAAWTGWRGTFGILGAIGVAYALLLALALPDSPAERAESRRDEPVSGGLGALLRDPRFLGLLAVVSLAGACNWLVMGWLPRYFAERFALSPGDAGFHANTWINVVMFASVIGGGALSDFLAARTPRARTLIPAAGFLVAAPGVWFGALSPTLGGAVCGFALFGMGQGFLDANLMPALRGVAPARLSATGYGVLNFTSCLAGGLMVLCAGRLRDTSSGFGAAFLAASGGLIVAVLVLLFVGSKRAAGKAA